MNKSRLLVIFSLVIFTRSILAAVPSFLHVCNRQNPNISECVLESVQNLTDRLKVGIPELSVPPLEPLFVEEIPLADIPDFKAGASNCRLGGLSNYKVVSLKIDISNHTIDTELLFPKIFLDADYDVKARIIVPIHEKGPLVSSTENVGAKVGLRYTLYEKKGKTYVFFPTMKIKLTITDYQAKFTPSTGPGHPLTEAINAVIEGSKFEIIESMLPNIEKAVSLKVLEIANRICKHFTYDELFPNRR